MRVLLFLAGAIAAMGLSAGHGHAQWQLATPVVDLGTVPEGTPARATFTLRNGGLVPIKLVRTEADCAVRIIRRPQSWVTPAGRAVIELELLTQGRLGAHDSRVILHHTGWDAPLELSIRAVVTKAEQGAFRGRDTVGSLVFSTLREHLSGLVRASQSRELSLRVLNRSSEAIEVFDSLRGPFELVPQRVRLLPGSPQQLLIRYRPGAAIAQPSGTLPGTTRWISFELPVRLFTTAASVPSVLLTLTGVFDPGVNGAGEAAPIAQFDRTEAVFRSPRPGSSASFTATNRGNAPLRLMPQVLASGELAVELADSVILPGATGQIRVSYRPPLQQQLPPRAAELRRSLAVVTNDPRQPLVLLTLRLGGQP